MNNAFDKARRLLSKKDYDYVFSKAQKMANHHFTILYRVNEIGYARLGLAISKKMIAKAHDRNRVKRILRETFRTRHQLPAIDIIVLAKSGVSKVANAQLIDNLEKAWNKL